MKKGRIRSRIISGIGVSGTNRQLSESRHLLLLSDQKSTACSPSSSSPSLLSSPSSSGPRSLIRPSAGHRVPPR
ncbi:hypothetical protein QN277_007952 [Acacia crassicarpa]|uniref:Uncharacterized protein n=1 Tax=Acacia crassicarpa TaxID=499986 RepID=A0AAE1M6Q3_9FABA|nr:hypothetical protein QN277_007952 [Acacia crassicarpa]